MSWPRYIRDSFMKFAYPENIGRWVVSWEFWLFLSPFRVAILDQRYLGDHDSYWTHLFPLLLLGILSSGVPLFIASQTVLKNRMVSKPAVAPIISTWLASDVLMTLTLNYLIGPENIRTGRLAEPFYIVLHAVATIPFGATVLMAWCVLFLSRDRSVHLRQSLLQQKGLLENLDEYYEIVRGKLSEQVSESIVPGFARIKREVSELAASKAFKGRYLEFADRVRQFSLSEVRELSHRIAVGSGESFERKNIDANAIVDNTRLAGTVLTPTSPFLACWFFFATQLVVNPESPIFFIGLETLVLWFSTDVAFKFYKIFAHASLKVRLPLLALMLLAPVAAVSATFVGVTRSNDPSSIALFTFCVVVMATAIAYPYRYYNELEARLTGAENAINETQASLRAASEDVRVRFSRVIHGKIQGRLALVSFLLGQLASGEIKARDRTAHLAKLQELVTLIDADLHRLTKPAKRVTLEKMAADLQRDWAGLLSLDLEVQAAARKVLKKDPELENTLSHLVEEAVLNARLHGNANQAVVWVRTIGPRHIHLIVADNGAGESVPSKSGLGKAMLTAATESWSLLRSESNHSVLTAVLVSDK